MSPRPNSRLLPFYILRSRTIDGRPTRVAIFYQHNSILKRPCNIVNPLDESVELCVDRMRRVLNSHRAMGIAAPQVGFPLRIIGFRLEQNKFGIMANPRIISMSKELQEVEELCLSSPYKKSLIKRPFSCKIKGFLYPNWESIDLEMEGLGSAVVIHEMDHLEGKQWPPKEDEI